MQTHRYTYVENALAAAAASKGNGLTFGVIVIEPAGPGMAIEDREQEVARAMVSNSALTDKKIEDVKAIEYRGLKAVRYRFTGNNILARSRVDNTVFIYKGKVYQVSCVGPGSDTAADGSTFQPFLDAFQLLDDAGQPKK